jgi:hypothetical protein
VNSRILYRTRSRKVTATAGRCHGQSQENGREHCKMDRGKVTFVTIRKLELVETGRVIGIFNRGVTIRIFDALWAWTALRQSRAGRVLSN